MLTYALAELGDQANIEAAPIYAKTSNQRKRFRYGRCTIMPCRTERLLGSLNEVGVYSLLQDEGASLPCVVEFFYALH